MSRLLVSSIVMFAIAGSVFALRVTGHMPAIPGGHLLAFNCAFDVKSSPDTDITRAAAVTAGSTMSSCPLTAGTLAKDASCSSKHGVADANIETVAATTASIDFAAAACKEECERIEDCSLIAATCPIASECPVEACDKPCGKAAPAVALRDVVTASDIE